MAPNQGENDELVPGENPSIGARVSTDWKAALKLYVDSRNQERTASQGAIQESQVVRQALGVYFDHLIDAGLMPEEARDLLDDDLVANAGSDLELEDDLYLSEDLNLGVES